MFMDAMNAPVIQRTIVLFVLIKMLKSQQMDSAHAQKVKVSIIMESVLIASLKDVNYVIGILFHVIHVLIPIVR